MPAPKHLGRKTPEAVLWIKGFVLVTVVVGVWLFYAPFVETGGREVPVVRWLVTSVCATVVLGSIAHVQVKRRQRS